MVVLIPAIILWIGLAAVAALPSPPNQAISGRGSTNDAMAASDSSDANGCQDGVLTKSNGATFIQICNADYYAGDLYMVQSTSYQNCINTCATTAGCTGLVFDLASDASNHHCYLKNDITTYSYTSAADVAIVIVDIDDYA